MKRQKCIGIIILIILSGGISYGEDGVAVMQQQIAQTDSLLMKLLVIPEIYQKQTAPADDVFRSIMAQHQEFITLIRTNARGIIVNVVSHDDSAASSGTDVSREPWFTMPRKDLKPYYSPLVQGNKHYLLVWSKPLIIKNAFGLDKFDGVIMAELNIALYFKQFALRFREPFQIYLNGKEFYYLTWYDNIPFEEKPFPIPGIRSLTIRYIPNRETAQSLMIKPDSVQKLPTALPSADTAGNRQKAILHSVGTTNAIKSTPAFGAGPAPTSAFFYILNNATMRLCLAGSLIVFLLLVILTSHFKKRHYSKSDKKNDHHGSGNPGTSCEDIRDSDDRNWRTMNSVSQLRERIRQQDNHSGDVIAGFPTEKDSAHTSISGTAEEKINSTACEESSDHKVSVEHQNIPVTPLPGIQSGSTAGVSASSADARPQEHQATAATLRQEIQEKFSDRLYQEELDTLRRSIHDKLVEKEMPVLLKSLKAELAKNIQQKVEAMYAAEFEQQERVSLRNAIIEKIHQEEYHVIMQEERTRLHKELSSKEFRRSDQGGGTEHRIFPYNVKTDRL